MKKIEVINSLNQSEDSTTKEIIRKLERNTLYLIKHSKDSNNLHFRMYGHPCETYHDISIAQLSFSENI